MSVDLSKLNKPGLGSGSFGVKQKNTGVSAQAAKNLANSSAATSKSIFSNTRSPNFVAGQNVAKQLSRYSYQGARMRANAPFVPRHTGYSGGVSHTVPKFEMPGQSGLSKFTQTMQEAVLLGQTIQAGVNLFTGTNALTNGINNMSKTSINTLSGKLQAANSFTDINDIETKMNSSMTSMNTEYQNIGNTAQNTINETLKDEDVTKGLELAKVNVENFPTLTNPLDVNNLDDAAQKVGEDIVKVQSFANGLNTNIGNVNSEKTKVAGNITAKTGELERLKAQRGTNSANATGLEAKISELENKIKDLEKQKEQLEKAENALRDIQKNCSSTVDEMKTKQFELRELKNTKEQLAQKKYNLAQTQKKELENLTKKLDKLNKAPDKNATEIAQLKKQVGKIVQSLAAAGNEKIKNPKGGETIDTEKLLETAKSYMN